MFKLASPLSADEEQIVSKTIGCGIEVHRVLGAGFRERIYERAFQLELESRGMRFECEKPIDVTYKKWKIPGQRIDLIVEDVVVVELKTVPEDQVSASAAAGVLPASDWPQGWSFNELQYGDLEERACQGRLRDQQEEPVFVSLASFAHFVIAGVTRVFVAVHRAIVPIVG